MNREEALAQIAQQCVFTYAGTTIGVVLPSHKEAKRFRKDLVVLLESLPEWVFSGFHHNNIHYIETIAGTRVSFMNNVHHTRGQSFTSLYVSSLVPKDEMTQYCFAIMPMLVGTSRTMITFKDA